MNTAHTPASVIDPARKWWTRTPAATAEHDTIVARQATEGADHRLAQLVADAVTAERAAADTRERELLDAEYERLAPLLARKSLPAYLAGVIPPHVRERYEAERSAV